MRQSKYWNWDKATEGMQAYLVHGIRESVIMGTVVDVKKSDMCRMVDGKPVKSTRVVSVTFECDDAERIEVERANPEYKIF